MSLEMLEDEALVEQAKSSVEAEGVLLSRYLGLIRFHAGKLAGSAEVDDLIQEGLIALLKAIPQYDAARGTDFSAYAQSCILNRMRNYIRKEARAAAPYENVVELMEAQGDLIDPDTPESILLEKEQFAQCRMQVMAMLSAREWEILQCIMDGLSYAQTADKLGTGLKSVDNAMQRIRRKMRAVRSMEHFGQN